MTTVTISVQFIVGLVFVVYGLAKRDAYAMAFGVFWYTIAQWRSA